MCTSPPYTPYVPYVPANSIPNCTMDGGGCGWDLACHSRHDHHHSPHDSPTPSRMHSNSKSPKPMSILGFVATFGGWCGFTCNINF